jgi:hypothetical protein
MARLIGVAVAKAELNNTVHLCSNQVCTVDFTPKPVHPALLSACVLDTVVVFKVKLKNSVHLCSNLYILSTACLLYNLYTIQHSLPARDIISQQT